MSPITLHALRGRRFPYLATRAISLARRYGIRDGKAMARVRRCVETLARYDLAPTFATPGSVIEREPAFFRGLEVMGVEFAIHGYDHVDFRLLDEAESRRQFDRAADAFHRNGISFAGFRCPYLSYTDRLARILPAEGFEYSSNKAISWDVIPRPPTGATFDQLEEFYSGAPAAEAVSTPWTAGPFVEIPVSLPDDLQLLDGVRIATDGVRDAWGTILDRTYERGELFAPLFHPESFDTLRVAVESLSDDVRNRQPHIWKTQLREIAHWWKERAAFAARAALDGALLRVELDCSDRGTVLVRDWDGNGNTKPWDGRYSVLLDRSVSVDPKARPFVGARGASERTVAFLREQGYVIDGDDDASSCTVMIDEAVDAALETDVRRLEFVESTQGPLLRFWRWPDEAKSAFCFAGDLDALSLREYAGRLFRR
jgi:peptidoglycan/xylan/chitin deacetylase (PgdA/CDA1 family)